VSDCPDERLRGGDGFLRVRVVKILVATQDGKWSNIWLAI
jgi:hypothetical protein